MMLKKIFPASADNNFDGNKIALWGFVIFTAAMTLRSIIHMFFEQYGFHEIASFILIEGNPDPMPIIYRFFSLWGFAQLIFCFVCWIVIFRYRALIPLMYLFWLVEWGHRAIGYSLTREEIAIQGIYTNSITPGIVLAPYVLLLLIILFALSLKSKN